MGSRGGGEKGSVVDHMAAMLEQREAPFIKAGVVSMAPFYNHSVDDL